MKRCTILCFSATLFFTLSNAYAVPASHEQYCVDNGGKVENLVAEFGTRSGMIPGFKKPFCTFSKDNGYLVIGLETYASQTPNLAATFIKQLPKLEDSSNLWKGEYVNPSLNVCKNLGGTSIVFQVMSGGFLSTLGQTDICVFGDGSMVSAWSLIYMANGRPGYDEVKRNIHSTALNINMPV